jgi:hypothetical protein
MSDDPREQVEQAEQAEQIAVPQDAVADLPPDETEQSKVQGGYGVFNRGINNKSISVW